MISKRAEALIRRAIENVSKAASYSDVRAIRSELESDLEAVGPKAASDGIRIFDAMVRQHTQNLVTRLNSPRSGARSSTFIGETRLKSFGQMEDMRERMAMAYAAGVDSDPTELAYVMEAAVNDAARKSSARKEPKEVWEKSLRAMVANYYAGQPKQRVDGEGIIADLLFPIFDRPKQLETVPRGAVLRLPGGAVKRTKVANPKHRKNSRKSRKKR